MVPQQFRFGRVVSDAALSVFRHAYFMQWRSGVVLSKWRRVVPDAALSVFRHAYFMQWRSGVVLSKWRRVVPDAAVSVILGHELFQLFVRSVHV